MPENWGEEENPEEDLEEGEESDEFGFDDVWD